MMNGFTIFHIAAGKGGPLSVLAAMIFWLVRVRFTAAFGRPRRGRQSAHQS